MTDHQFDTLISNLPTLFVALATFVASVLGAWAAFRTKTKVTQVSQDQATNHSDTMSAVTGNTAVTNAAARKVGVSEAIIADSQPILIKPPYGNAT
jgi:hypothetical protein